MLRNMGQKRWLLIWNCLWIQVLLGRARRIALVLQRQMNLAAPQPLLQVIHACLASTLNPCRIGPGMAGFKPK